MAATALKYIIEVIICSALFLVCYRWMIARKVSFRLCRMFIMTSMMLSVVIPALNVPLYRFEKTSEIPVWMLDGLEADFVRADEAAADEAGAAAEAGVAVPENAGNMAGVPAMEVSEEASARMDRSQIIAAAYFATVLASLALLAYNFLRIRTLKKKSKLTYTKDYTLAEHEETKTPFSFLRTIFMGFNYEPDERIQILTHEASHVKHGHSSERLVLSVMRSFFWFNPFFWMAEKDLKEVQEWEADKDVLDQGHELNAYRLTIFKQLFGYNPDISCGLNHSLTKQRFIMMTQSHRGKGAWIRLAATLPVIAAVFLAFGCGARSPKPEHADNQAGTNLADTTAIHLSMPCNPIRFMSTHGSKTAQSGFSGKHVGVDFALNEGDPVWAAADGHLVSIESGDETIVTHDMTTNITEFHHPENIDLPAETASRPGRFNIGDIEVNLTGRDGLEEFRCGPESPGMTVRIMHENGIETIYRNVPYVILRPDRIKAGQMIGKAGMTARSTGVHLHFEVHKDGEPVDPMPYLNSPASTAKAVFIDITKAGKNENRLSDEYLMTVDGDICTKEKLAETIAQKMEKDRNIGFVQISADPQTPMAIIADLKEQLRKIESVKVMFVSEAGAMQSLPMADTTHVYNPRYDMTEISFGTEVRNIIHMKINAQDRYLIGSRPGILNGKTMERLKSYIANSDNDENCPERTETEISLPDGSSFTYGIPQGMILFQYDRGTSYKGYYEARSFVDKAYYELWDELAADRFGRPYTQLSHAEMKAIHSAIPKNVYMFDMKATRYPISGK